MIPVGALFGIAAALRRSKNDRPTSWRPPVMVLGWFVFFFGALGVVGNTLPILVVPLIVLTVTGIVLQVFLGRFLTRVFLVKRGRVAATRRFGPWLNVFSCSAEPIAGVAFHVALALAYRGDPTRDEVREIRKYLKKATAEGEWYLGTLGVLAALESTVAARDGHRDEAMELERRAIALHELLLFLSPGLRQPWLHGEHAFDFLMLSAASRGDFRAIVATPDPGARTGHRQALRRFAKRIFGEFSTATECSDERFVDLFQRTKEGAPVSDPASDSSANVASGLARVARGAPMSESEFSNLLTLLDRAWTPEANGGRIPRFLAGDPDLEEEALGDLIGLLAAHPITEFFPLHLQNQPGRVSVALSDHLGSVGKERLDRLLAPLKETLPAARAGTVMQHSAEEAWHGLADAFAHYRRFQKTLGDPFISATFDSYERAIGFYAVMLSSNNVPRRSAIAYAAFHHLAIECVRYARGDDMVRNRKNCEITKNAYF